MSKPSSLRPGKGTRTVPFLSATLRGFLTIDLGGKAPICTQLYIVPAALSVLLLRPVRGPERSPFYSAVLPVLPSSTSKGTRTVPFFIAALRGILLVDLVLEQERLTTLFLDPGSTLLYIFFKKPPVASYSNPKKSQSRRLLHSCIVLCVLHMFYAYFSTNCNLIHPSVIFTEFFNHLGGETLCKPW